MNNYFYVDTDDEITSVIGKIREEKTEEIFLVVPKRALIAQSLVNLRLLDKEAKKHKKKLVFVSPDAHIRKLAEKAGLAVKKYVAKPKEEKKEEAITLAPKARKLEPWEEEAAKKELASIIKKEEEVRPGPIREKIVAPTLPSGTKITVGAFSKPGNIVSREKAKRSAEVIDLKKTQLRRKDISFARKKLTCPSGRRESVPPKPRASLPGPPIREKPILSKKDVLPQEDVERKVANGKMDIGRKKTTAEPRKDIQAIVNPFKVRKLEERGAAPTRVGSGLPPDAGLAGRQGRADRPEPENSAIAEIEGSSQRLEPTMETSDGQGRPEPTSVATPPFASSGFRAGQSPVPAGEENVGKIDNIERETAHLTLKEKEKLRDLWMEQKGMVRGKYVRSSASLDLAAIKKESNGEEKIFSQSSGFFKTTHRRVGNSGKIVDLRLNPEKISESSQADLQTTRLPVLRRMFQPASPELRRDKQGEPLNQGGSRQQKGRKVVLLPLVNIKFFSLFVSVILLALAVIVGIIIPDARVVIKSNVNKSDLTINFWVSGEVSQIDVNEHMIPGKPIRFKVMEEKSFPTSGSREIKENAQGQITIYNKTGNPLSLKQNALITDGSGRKFYTQVPALVPAGETASSNSNDNTGAAVAEIKAGSATVAIRAEGTGKEYNLKEGAALNIPGLADSDFGSGITVEVKKEVVGGESRTVKTVTREDLENAKTELVNKAREDSRAELEKNLNADTTMIVKPEILSVEDLAYTASKAEGEEADTFNANLAATFFAVAFTRKDLEDLSKNIVEENSSVKDGNVAMNDYSLTEAKPLENKMEISANLSYQRTVQLDVAEIRRQLVAKKKSEAEEFLRSNKDIAEFTLDLWPGWPARLPLLERRIKVEIKE